MFESDRALAKIVEYMRAHWPSKVKPEWQVGLEEYPEIAERAVAELIVEVTRNRKLIRIAGVSGSGKTTQILPAVEAYAKKNELKPVLMAARRFVEYHPHYKKILEHYGEENLRKMTDEFSTIMLFLTLIKLIEGGYDIVLDVTLLDPEMEAILLKMTTMQQYKMTILMIAVSPTVTEHFLQGRPWRHTKETEAEFIRATEKALGFYAESAPELKIILWSVYDKEPVYDGPVRGCLAMFAEYSERDDLPQKDDDARREAKVKYLTAG